MGENVQPERLTRLTRPASNTSSSKSSSRPAFVTRRGSESTTLTANPSATFCLQKEIERSVYLVMKPRISQVSQVEHYRSGPYFTKDAFVGR